MVKKSGKRVYEDDTDREDECKTDRKEDGRRDALCEGNATNPNS
jgi:hypothetical protein